ncbi:tyrosyl-DNA phosphodiesterase 2 [Peromyscus maniculatus bairdii]|uniref:Tyrosyl-DNA phosphodiesterase 2 n=1 Tax=Peromyscus maniculatus bairdii TaxID=230844 RepID=A0A6I9LDC2_PERMB|nr:tyrosyl-DNA phosphodiesterase 2 [Peromyscus maniculatus bairdii]
MASGSGSDAAELAEPAAAAPAAAEAEEEVDNPVKRRRLQCMGFALVAKCDPTMAHTFLSENDWQMDKALSAFFEPPENDPAWPRQPPTTFRSEAYVDLTNEDENDTTTLESSSSGPPLEDSSIISFITWNIDGLDGNNLPERARGVCSCLALYSPDVVFLQEVIPSYCAYLKKRANSYKIITGNEEGYFTAILLKKGRVKFKSQEIVPFPNTKMMRNLLCVNVSLGGNEFCLMTSHLESTREHSAERISQLKTVFQKMQEAPDSTTVIFAGDTNLRDQEVTKCGGLPDNVFDAWEFLGKPKHCQYTWDTRINTNLRIPAACKHRFDRIFFRAEEGHLIPQSLDLVGLEKLDCGRFPSDHWGLLCTLNVVL